ncbi:immunoglobulin-like domain-containing protein [Listeria riparia]|uniref:Modifier protein of major autolysin LytC n=1 Tax=Listeria riparia FSL S10-1204 TaxID=1265816 RepID=W7DAR8_9LIST|nr:immunoglobulin-like domain-containing protein [Listeria riparia]EUJ42353.1 modifier protein of major autolysin LytC [Listeria riparia FSL S10-1204]
MGLLAFNVLASAPLTTISVNADEVNLSTKGDVKLLNGLKATTNLLVNPQLSNINGWSIHGNYTPLTMSAPNASGWQSYSESGRTYSVKAEGNGSVIVGINGGDTTIIDQQIPTIAGHKYRVSYTSSPLSGDVGYRVKVYVGDKTVVSTDGSIVGYEDYRKSDGKPHTLEFTAVDDSTGIGFGVAEVNQSAGTMRYSNLIVEDITTIAQTTITNTISTQDVLVKGVGEPNGNVSITNFGKEIGAGKVDAQGNYSITIPKQVYGSTVTATVTAKQLTSSATKTVVQGAIENPIINPITTKDTIVSGKGEPGSALTVKANGIEYSQIIANDGTWKLTIPKQATGSVVTAKSVLNGVSSLETTTQVSYEGPSTPTINTVTNLSKKVTGTGDPGNAITIKVKTGDDSISYSGKVDDFGEYSISIYTPEAGSTIEAIAKDSSNTLSEKASKLVTDVIAPDAPIIQPVKSNDTKITGSGEANTVVKVVLPLGAIVNGKTDDKGNFSINIPKQDEGSKIYVTLTDLAGNESEVTTVTVQANAIAAPTINSVTTDSTTVTGTGIAGATVQIKINDILYKGTVKSDGTYSITIPKQTAGSRILANQIYNDVVSASVGAFVTQGKVAAPTINALTTDDTTATGTGIVGASVKVKANNIEYTGTVKTDGTYSIAIPKQAANTVVTATQTLNNVTSSAVSTTVKATAVTATLTANNFTIGVDNYIKGTYTGDIAKLAIEVNGVLQQTINATGSPYQYYAKGKVNAGTDQVYVIGYDATGKQLQKTKVTVKQQTVGTITPNTFYIGTENYVTGKLSGNVAKFSMTVNGVEYSKINVTNAPDFKYYANNIITKITDVVKMNAYDASGKLLDSKPVSVTTYQGEEGKITSVAPFKLGKDSYVTGAYTGDVKKVELQVNGVALQRINVTGGTIKYYAKANITKTTDVVKLVGYNTAGVAVSTKAISVSAADGTVTANPFVIGQDGYVKGKYTGDVAKISLTVNGVKQTTISVPAGSDYQYYAKTLIKNATDVVVVTAYDAVGGVLATANVSVSDSKAATTGTVTPNAFKLGADAYVDGTYTGDVAKVELEVNGVKYGRIPASGNTIHYYASSLITNASDVVNVHVYDAAGKLLDSKPVSVVAPTGTVTATAVKVGDSYLRGTATGDVTKVALSINGTVQSSTAFVQPDGSYQYYIKNLNLKATDEVKVIGMDARGNTINTANVTITN